MQIYEKFLRTMNGCGSATLQLKVETITVGFCQHIAINYK